jgi:hypothetical protein
MKLKGKINAGSEELKRLQLSNEMEIIDTRGVEFICSDGLTVLKTKPRTRIILGDRVRELIEISNK